MQSGGGKNPPWARSNVNANMTGMNNQMLDANSMMPQQGIMPFQQQQVFNKNFMQPQSGMGMAMSGQMPMNQMAQGQIYPGNVVAYPAPRGMNPGLYQNQNSNANQPAGEQRVFTGTVTQAHNDIGFVDNDVFYQTSVCAKGIIPKVNDRVLVEATYNPSMPFKWNATRVQVLPKGGNNNMKQNPPHNNKSNSYNAAPPPSMNNKKSIPSRRDDRPLPRRDDRIKQSSQKRSRTRSRSRSRDRHSSRNRRDSPPRKRPVVHAPSPPKYSVRVPRMPLDVSKLDVPALSQRYTNLYVPSDFFAAQVKWGETFPPQTSFSLNNPCAYHIMPKDVPNPIENDTVLEPPDADYRFSAKVMLISMPTLESLYQKCGLTKSDKDDKDKRSSSKASPQHPTRLIKFLVGQKGKGGENFAIGGPWSPSLDGENPDTDPGVLVKTAIRTCKALTGIDLSVCSQWYRMVEFYYWREGSGGRSRLETVVVFLPAPATPLPQQWPSTQQLYAAAAQAAIDKLHAKLDGDKPKDHSPIDADATVCDTSINETITIDEDNDADTVKPEPTHYSKIELKTIKVASLRDELRARDASIKGNRSQLVSRLSKLIKAEEAKEKGEETVTVDEDKKEEPIVLETVEIKDDKDDEKSDEKQEKTEEKKLTEKEIEEIKKKIEKEKQHIKSAYELPSLPHVIVHPNGTAKGGKFHCSVATLSLLLDYRISDNKEHSFELFVFAELFNEMLMRDFGFYIYKTLYTLPEKAEEVKEVKDKEKQPERESEKKEEKEVEKKEDKRDDKRDSRRRDKKEGSSDDERSSSHRSRGVELPPDPYLLLALVYFDTARGGNINKKDLQNLFMSLGLQLSRSQLKAILDKVCQRDNFNYKSLIQCIRDVSSGTAEALQDLPLDTASVQELPVQIAELEQTIAAGNRDLLPVFDRPTEDGAKTEVREVGDNTLVRYKSRAICVGALVEGEARLAAQKLQLESALEVARRQLAAARAAAHTTLQAERGAQTQLADLTRSLAAARARLAALTASCKIFHSALKSIQTKAEAVVNIKFEDDDVIEVNGPKSEKKDIKTEDPKDTKESVTEANKDNDQVIEAPEGNTETKEQDNTATENMDIDDK